MLYSVAYAVSRSLSLSILLVQLDIFFIQGLDDLHVKTNKV